MGIGNKQFGLTLKVLKIILKLFAEGKHKTHSCDGAV
jgi:hypothetical protein